MADKKLKIGIRVIFALSLALVLLPGFGCGAHDSTPEFTSTGPGISASYHRVGETPSVFTPVNVSLDKNGTALLAFPLYSSYGGSQYIYSIIDGELLIYSPEDDGVIAQGVIARFEMVVDDTLVVLSVAEPLHAAPGDRYVGGRIMESWTTRN